MLTSRKITVTTTGDAGAASGNGYSSRPICGEIRALVVDWSASAPATSHITVSVESDDSHPAITLFAKEDSVTDVTVYPKVQNTDTAGSAIAAQYQNIVAEGRIKVAVANCDALAAAVTVTAYVWE